MNLQNQQLASIRRQIKVYKKKMSKETDQQVLYDLSKKIESLNKEESKILKEMGVIDSNEMFYR